MRKPQRLALLFLAASAALGAENVPALVWAAHQNDTKTAERLLRAGVGVNARSMFGATALSEAAQNGNAVLIGELLAAGADANAATGEGETALHSAAHEGNP